jgi:DNA-binding Lrp family transcriptional regulator
MLPLETAYVMINCEMGAEGTIVEGVKSIDSVKEVSGVFGNYDVIVKLECLDVEEVRETISKKIRLMSKVRCTTTLMCAN